MTPAAPTRSDADVIATDQATPPKNEDGTPPDAAAPSASTAPILSAASTDTPAPPREAGPEATRAAEVAAMFDELAPVHDRMATILSLGLDRRWRAAVVAEARLAAGDSAIDVAAGTGLLAAELADRVGPFGRIVAVDLSPAM